MESSLGSAHRENPDLNQKIFKWIKLFAVSVFVLALFYFVSDVFLLIFAGILLAIFLSSLAQWTSKISKFSYGWSLAIVCFGILGAAVAMGESLAPSVAEQFDELTAKIPESLEKIRNQLQQYSWMDPILNQTDPKKVVGSSRDVVSRVTGVLSGFVGSLANLGIILFMGLYGAAEPGTYKRGFLHLIPLTRRPRVGEVLTETVETLKWWLVGKFMSMSVVGAFTTLGLWLLDVPLALSLGIIAALLTFIPNIGPILSAVPAVLLGLIESPIKALYIAILYIVIQVIESYMITPLIQRKTVNLPPGLTLSAQVLLGVLFGVLGVALATPMTAALLVGMKRFYVEDSLGDKSFG